MSLFGSGGRVDEEPLAQTQMLIRAERDQKKKGLMQKAEEGAERLQQSKDALDSDATLSPQAKMAVNNARTLFSRDKRNYRAGVGLESNEQDEFLKALNSLASGTV